MSDPSPLRGAIAALSEQRVIARDGRIPWHHPADLQHFKRRTLGHIIVMGRKTWESLGSEPLPKRHNIVLSRRQLSGVEHYNSVEAVLARYADQDLWIIGGAEIYHAALPCLNLLDLTWVPERPAPEGSILFPLIDEREWQASERQELGPGLVNVCYRRAGSGVNGDD